MELAYSRLLAFPVEILDAIFQELELEQLPHLLRTCSFVHSIANRVLYRIIPELPIRRCVACLKSLSQNPENARLVRRLNIDWSSHRAVANLFRLLRDTLTHLTHLLHLSIELSPRNNTFSLAWVLHGLRAPLRSLGTSIFCDGQLAQVLDTQPDLLELCLRGFPAKQPFVISTTAMPRLRSFRAVHAGPSLISTIVRGRPVEVVSISMFTEDGADPLQALVLSSTPVKRLTIMSIDQTLAPHVLLPEVARRLPLLEALHVVVLMAMFDTVSGRLGYGHCGLLSLLDIRDPCPQFLPRVRIKTLSRSAPLSPQFEVVHPLVMFFAPYVNTERGHMIIRYPKWHQTVTSNTLVLCARNARRESIACPTTTVGQALHLGRRHGVSSLSAHVRLPRTRVAEARPNRRRHAEPTPIENAARHRAQPGRVLGPPLFDIHGRRDRVG